jgi:regulator of sirC expression with transglutaminase-like and TPR domain
VCDQALALDAKHIEAWLTRANARALDGDLTGAIVDLTRAIEVHPTHVTALTSRGAVHLRLKQHAAAEADATAALRVRPGDPDALLTRARARVALDDVPGARGDCEALSTSLEATRDQRAKAAEILASLG